VAALLDVHSYPRDFRWRGRGDAAALDVLLLHYSPRDAFVAGLCAHLRRAGLACDIMRAKEGYNRNIEAARARGLPYALLELNEGRLGGDSARMSRATAAIAAYVESYLWGQELRASGAMSYFGGV
jgi:hypothetical protein